jgi:hypothetical protein
MRRTWVGVDLNSVLHGALPRVSVLSGVTATEQIRVRFGLVTSQRVPPGGRVGYHAMQFLGRLRVVPYARTTEVALLPVTAAELRLERLRMIASVALAAASILSWVVRPVLPPFQPDGVARGYDSVLVLFVILFGAAVAIRPRARVRVSTKDALKGRARVLAHPAFVAALPAEMRRGLGRYYGRVS